MSAETSTASLGKVLVSDFDGTMTQHDFYRLAIERLIPADTPDYWVEYRAGKITHFEALRRYFAAIRSDDAQILDVVGQMGLDSQLAESVGQLQNAGWQVIVASAGCAWYIRRLLDAAGVSLQVHANPGHLVTGQGLKMELPGDSPFLSMELGINKTAIVQHYLKEGATVAFAGDGFPDADPARLVPDDLRFARGDLAKVLDSEGLPYHRYAHWSDVARYLLQLS